MACDHCLTQRAASAAWLASRGFTGWIDWARRPIDQFMIMPDFTYTGTVPIDDCPCECHSFARIAGPLPRL